MYNIYIYSINSKAAHTLYLDSPEYVQRELHSRPGSSEPRKGLEADFVAKWFRGCHFRPVSKMKPQGSLGSI